MMTIHRIERLATELVQQAPDLDPATLAELTRALDDQPFADRPLARSIAAIYAHVAAGRVDPAIALPALAMACATLCDPRSTERELEAARYEIDTLEPMPQPLVTLSRGPRPRT